eukprot:3089176-Pleurochrysis_carterae.AAC.1
MTESCVTLVSPSPCHHPCFYCLKLVYCVLAATPSIRRQSSAVCLRLRPTEYRQWTHAQRSSHRYIKIMPSIVQQKQTGAAEWHAKAVAAKAIALFTLNYRNIICKWHRETTPKSEIPDVGLRKAQYGGDDKCTGSASFLILDNIRCLRSKSVWADSCKMFLSHTRSSY